LETLRGFPLERVGGAELSSAKPERGKVWKPSEGFHQNLGSVGEAVVEKIRKIEGVIMARLIPKT
jgi:hypothetical protein